MTTGGRAGGRRGGAAGRRGAREAPTGRGRRTGRETKVVDDHHSSCAAAPAEASPPRGHQQDQRRLDDGAERGGGGGTTRTTTRGGRTIGRGGRCGRSGRRASDFMAWQQEEQHDDQRKQYDSFQVGDACFTDIGGAIRSGTVIQLPVRGRKQKFYRIKLDKEQEDGEEEGEEEEVVAEMGNVYRSDDTVPSIKNHDKRTRDTSPWQTSRAKRFFHERLLNENDSIHDKTEDQIFHTSFYNDGIPVVKTKYTLANFKANFKRLKAKLAQNKAAATEDDAAFELERKLYPRPATDFHGHPYYAGSKIRSSLIGDVKSGAAAANSKKKPLEIIASREDYAPFQSASKTFRNYLYRERRKESESVGWQLRRNKKGYKQHEKDHEEATRKPSSNLVG